MRPRRHIPSASYSNLIQIGSCLCREIIRQLYLLCTTTVYIGRIRRSYSNTTFYGKRFVHYIHTLARTITAIVYSFKQYIYFIIILLLKNSIKIAWSPLIYIWKQNSVTKSTYKDGESDTTRPFCVHSIFSRVFGFYLSVSRFRFWPAIGRVGFYTIRVPAASICERFYFFRAAWVVLG